MPLSSHCFPALCRRWIAVLLLTWPLAYAAAENPTGFRPPSVPLIVHDPLFSIWSDADQLTDDATRHWTHVRNSLVCLVRVDGKSYRLMGGTPANVPPLPQKSLVVTPTRTLYEFEGAGVAVDFAFMTPALPDDLDVLTRPVTYLTWTVHSTDGAEHAVSIYDSTSAELTVNDPGEKVRWSREAMGPLTALRAGSDEQDILSVSGDNARIDWGYVYEVAPTAQSAAAAGAEDALTRSFVDSGALPMGDDMRMPRAANDDQPVLAFVFDLGRVGENPVSRHLMVGYDEISEIRFFRSNLAPWWRRNGATPADLFQQAERDYPALKERCADFDRRLLADATKAGGSDYATICALAYRQALGGNGIAADANGQPLMFTKENSSNGDIATVDVFYPGDPLFLLLSPTLAKASLVPILAYAASDHWKFPSAPHDLGKYPVAFGRDKGGESMPVEESGNMLILCDAISQIEGNGKFVEPWWPQLTQWAKFLEQYGIDPEDQLCTDDFMGHLAHNANLSVKAIVALAAYGDLCQRRGDASEAQRYARLAKDDAAHWIQAAEAGDHSLLAFDKPGTWSQKYNLVWDRILGLNVFPPEVAQKEIAFYKTVMQPYGLPLDSRTTLTKTDWTLWSATLADQTDDFEKIVSPIVRYLDQTTTRRPFVDSYKTDNTAGKTFYARPVIGGVFIKLLADRATWSRWASADRTPVGAWARLPNPTLTEVIPTSQQTPQAWRYATEPPPANWAAPDFNDSNWLEGPGGFGNAGAHHTDWKTPDIWIRRTFTMPAGEHPDLVFNVFHDDDAEIYVNGVLAARGKGYLKEYDQLPIREDARALLKAGEKITLAVHCHQIKGGQGIDVGLADLKD